MDKNKKKRRRIIIDAVIVTIRLGFFVAWPALFATAFGGVKQVAESIAKQESLPWNPFIFTLLVLLGFTIVFGRFFCGFACALGTWGDAVYWISSQIQKKRRKRPLRCLKKGERILRFGKYAVLVIVLILCIEGFGAQVALHSPFSAFSRIRQFAVPESRAGLVLFLLITVGMALEPRCFCRFFCPMGAVFSLMPVLPFSVLKREKKQCVNGCNACQNICPAHLELPSDSQGDNVLSGECFSCGKCRRQCPRQNVYGGLQKALFLPSLVAKAALLAVLATNL
ncbi:MAG: 4Fe-4S binding protein [Eubacteriales bacterium]|nr:4Fe-4S binding protein [Eubacteriales bacterium]